MSPEEIIMIVPQYKSNIFRILWSKIDNLEPSSERQKVQQNVEHKSIKEQKPQSILFKDEIFVIGYMKNVCHLFGLTSFQFSVTGHKLTLWS